MKERQIGGLPYSLVRKQSGTGSLVLDMALARQTASYANCARAEGVFNNVNRLTRVVISAVTTPEVGGIWRVIKYRQPTATVVIPDGQHSEAILRQLRNPDPLALTALGLVVSGMQWLDAGRKVCCSVTETVDGFVQNCPRMAQLPVGWSGLPPQFTVPF